MPGEAEADAAACPGGIVMDYHGRKITLQELLTASAALAGYMQRYLAVRRGARVLLMMRECPQFVMTWYAALRCDAVVVAVPHNSPADEVARHVEDSGACAAVVMQDALPRVVPLLGARGLRNCVVGAYSEFGPAPATEAWLRAPEHVRDPRVPLLQPRVHEFSDALALGFVQPSLSVTSRALTQSPAASKTDCLVQPI
ncbi:AMP-binding protein [Cupriavidus metallidurans]|uniref:AMP-binding protein n=1 Tax=Cupriavidus metallidurans TaxID=119219 RepID=UPI00164F9713|nr:AMP-binding protein [Cupriavidus metallidurans]